MRNEMKLGISGGTFDPIHFGHLIVAEEIRQSMKLDRVVFIPSGNPPHKRGIVTESALRYTMVKEAVSTNPYFDVSDIELNRTGYSYSVDTLTQLKSLYGSETRLFFIVGADVVHELTTWKDYEKVFRLCEFVAVMRPGYDKKDFLKEAEELKKKMNAIVHVAEVPLIEISSTDIRDRIKAGRTIKYLVPACVEDYIVKNGLYAREMTGRI